VEQFQMLGRPADQPRHLPGFGPDHALAIEVLGPVIERPGDVPAPRWLRVCETKYGHSILLRLRYRDISILLGHRMAWKRASMAAALGYHPDGTRARLCFHLQADSYNTDSLIKVLKQLRASTPASGWSCCGMGCRRTGATRCAPTWTPSATGS
jgi:hypothetical protein